MTDIFLEPWLTTWTCALHGDLAGSMISATRKRQISFLMNFVSSALYRRDLQACTLEEEIRTTFEVPPLQQLQKFDRSKMKQARQ